MMILNRFFVPTNSGTFGTLVYNHDWWFTIELPWKNNIPNFSCIPVGEYPIRKSLYTNKKGLRFPSFEIIVPDRSGIKIHVANKTSDLQGCIGLGKNLLFTKYGCQITESKKAIDEFVDATRLIDENYKEIIEIRQTHFIEHLI